MIAAQFLKTRVSPDTKKLVQAAARRQLLTESIWLRRTVDAALRARASNSPDVPSGVESAHAARLYVRLRTEDRLLLRERAAARGMAAATYVSVLVRAHLRALAPLPRDELLALKRTVAELGAIGRNLNQIARAANQGGLPTGPGREHLRGMLKVCEGLRDNVKALIRANLVSWESGHAEANN